MLKEIKVNYLIGTTLAHVFIKAEYIQKENFQDTTCFNFLNIFLN